MRIIVTRPAEDAGETARKLTALGHEVFLAPVLEVRFLPFAIPDENFQAFAATSTNGVRAIASVLSGLPDARDLRRRRVYAVGQRTAQAARETGFSDVLTPPDPGGVEALAAYVAAEADPQDGPLLYVSGRDTAGDLAGALSAKGFPVKQITGYAADAVSGLPGDVRELLMAGSADAVLFYSARSASAFFAAASQIMGAIAASGLRFLCLSPGVAAMMPETIASERVMIAKSPEESALLDLIDAAAGHGPQA